MTKFLTENLDYLDMENQIEPKFSVDEYVSKIGKDSDIITLAFTVFSKMCAEDLVTWFERGYDFVLDASISEGELEPGKWLVFLEMDRRTMAPTRILKLITELETLTGLKPSQWTVDIAGEDYDLDVDVIGQVMILSPGEYTEMEKDNDLEEELNEMRELAGLEPISTYEPVASMNYLRELAGLV